MDDKTKEKETELPKPKISYETLWKIIIRPERLIYELKDLMWEYLVGKNVELDLKHQYNIYLKKKKREYR